MSRSSESPTDEVIVAIMAGIFSPSGAWIGAPITEVISDLVAAEGESAIDAEEFGEKFAEAIRIRNRRAAIIRDIIKLSDLANAMNGDMDSAEVAGMVRHFLPR